VSDVHNYESRAQEALAGAIRNLRVNFTVLNQIIDRIYLIDKKSKKDKGDEITRANGIETIQKGIFPRVDTVLGVLTDLKLTGHIVPWLQFKQQFGFSIKHFGPSEHSTCKGFLEDLEAFFVSLENRVPRVWVSGDPKPAQNLMELKRNLEIIERNATLHIKLRKEQAHGGQLNNCVSQIRMTFVPLDGLIAYFTKKDNSIDNLWLSLKNTMTSAEFKDEKALQLVQQLLAWAKGP
jgi:hypothetical protein